MREEYIKETKIIDKSDEERKRELIKSIIITQKILNQAHQNFEYAEDDLIDYYSYNIKANQAKLDYLIKKAKSNGIIMDAVTQNKLKFFSDVG